ncbi:hypothetical protein ACFQZV_02540 [Microbacterium koreense]|uniref:PH domain-containing protein n=1 Tax=Microbacterium koreense TaxID=323761 RepID=A0ABW2ZNG0_9MICO
MSDKSGWRTRRVHLTVWVRATLLLAPLIAAVFIPGEFADPEGNPWPLIIVFVLMVICMWPLAFASHWIESDAGGLTLKYWPLVSRRIEYQALASVDFRQSASPWEFSGIGLRIASGRVLAFVNRRGPGIGLRVKDGRGYFVILADVVELTAVQDDLARARPDLTPRAG